ncbi:hypothetical protein SESBI_24100 [Sesbania bispinosa]|nr:hypothetical protein SESBI_24100 [Sesbania bispinosa]
MTNQGLIVNMVVNEESPRLESETKDCARAKMVTDNSNLEEPCQEIVSNDVIVNRGQNNTRP